MSLVSLNSILSDARKNHYAVPAFDVSNYEMIHAVIDVCQEERAPAIFMLLKPDMADRGQEYLISIAKTAAGLADIPVCIHLDHATQFDDIVSCMDAGATSVMYDGSMLPYEQNMENTRRVVEASHQRGISVEAELGHVTDAIGGLSERGTASENEPSIDACLTDPGQVVEFAKNTGVDCLAVAIGTAHGVYIATPTLHLERLKEIEAVSPCPLVLHGGSGTPDADIQKAIALGITKINIYSDLLAAMNKGLKDKLNAIDNLSAWPVVVWSVARPAMRDVVRKKIRAFGANGRL